MPSMSPTDLFSRVRTRMDTLRNYTATAAEFDTFSAVLLLLRHH